VGLLLLKYILRKDLGQSRGTDRLTEAELKQTMTEVLTEGEKLMLTLAEQGRDDLT
jgi:hypothetical protein